MLKYVQVFLDRLAERLVVVASRLVASSVDSLHATQQAAKQSQLEDLAREYEADGKLEIAATLRGRAMQLADASPAEEAMATLKSVVEDPRALAFSPDAHADDEPGPLALPDSQNGALKKPRRKKTQRSQAKKNDAPTFGPFIDREPRSSQ